MDTVAGAELPQPWHHVVDTVAGAELPQPWHHVVDTVAGAELESEKRGSPGIERGTIKAIAAKTETRPNRRDRWDQLLATESRQTSQNPSEKASRIQVGQNSSSP